MKPDPSLFFVCSTSSITQAVVLAVLWYVSMVIAVQLEVATVALQYNRYIFCNAFDFNQVVDRTRTLSAHTFTEPLLNSL